MKNLIRKAARNYGQHLQLTFYTTETLIHHKQEFNLQLTPLLLEIVTLGINNKIINYNFPEANIL